MQVQQMQALVAQTQAAKQDAQDTKVQLDASAEQLQRQVQEITSLSVSFLGQMQHSLVALCLLITYFGV